MEFSDPQPSFEEPRKWMIRLATHDLKVVNKNLDAINLVLKEYPTETIKIAVVAYASGMRAIKKDYDKATLSRIRALQGYDVEFVGCKNTMETMEWIESDFIDGVSYAQAGLAESIERVVDGWIDITPYTYLHKIHE